MVKEDTFEQTFLQRRSTSGQYANEDMPNMVSHLENEI